MKNATYCVAFVALLHHLGKFAECAYIKQSGKSDNSLNMGLS
ncbi:MAG: hypothetical protein Q4A74_07320 [Cardiobacteriaceae bacterium]|nr:hypothetical protein [Cardiobacteriaceae bacterium]